MLQAEQNGPCRALPILRRPHPRNATPCCGCWSPLPGWCRPARHARSVSLLVMVGGHHGLGVRRPFRACGLVLPGDMGGIARGGLAGDPDCASQGRLMVQKV